MTKSDELCRLLGIEAKRIYWGGSGDGIEIYPDLTRPSNFCKLIQCVCKCVGGLWFEFHGNVETTLLEVYKYISNEYLNEDVLNYIQHQSQQTEFEY